MWQDGQSVRLLLWISHVVYIPNACMMDIISIVWQMCVKTKAIMIPLKVFLLFLRHLVLSKLASRAQCP